MSNIDYAVMPYDDYAAICDAVRSKTGLAKVIKSGELAELIESISGNGKTVATIVCSTTNNGVLYGDVNNDGVIDDADRQILAGDEYGSVDTSSINVNAVDIDGDGIMGTTDLISITRNINAMSDGQVLAKVTITYTDGTDESRLFIVDAPTIEPGTTPTLNGKTYATGTWVQSGDSNGPIFIPHNLGRMPTSISVWAEVENVEAYGLVSVVYIASMSSLGVNYFNSTESGIQTALAGNISVNENTFTITLPTNVKLVDGWTYYWEAI